NGLGVSAGGVVGIRAHYNAGEEDCVVTPSTSPSIDVVASSGSRSFGPVLGATLASGNGLPETESSQTWTFAIEVRNSFFLPFRSMHVNGGLTARVCIDS